MIPLAFYFAANIPGRPGVTQSMDDGRPAPIVGITTAFDDGTDLDSLRPSVAVHFIDAAYGIVVEHVGAVPLVLPMSASEDVARRYVGMVDGLIFTGGGGFLRRRHLSQHVLPDLRTIAPRRFRFESMLLRMALQADVPVLGICRGHQMIVRVMGGSIYSRIHHHFPEALNHHVDEQPLGRAAAHDIVVEHGTMLHDMIGERRVGVNSLHRQAAQRVPAPLIVSARSSDGIIEAVESTAHRFVVGVQFHPELLIGTVSVWRHLFESFVAACGQTASKRSHRSSPVA